MQLEEMRMAQQDGRRRPELGDESAKRPRPNSSGLLAAVDEDLRRNGPPGTRRSTAGRSAQSCAAEGSMVALLDRRRYSRNLVRDVNETLEALISGSIRCQTEKSEIDGGRTRSRNRPRDHKFPGRIYGRR